jgi:hypothetical protein
MIRWSYSTTNVTPDMLKGFFRGWKKPRTPEEQPEILKNSSHVVLAIETETDRARPRPRQSRKIVVEAVASHQAGNCGTHRQRRMIGGLR